MPAAVGQATWLTPASLAWESRFGKGSFPFAMAGRLLKPLAKNGGVSPEQLGEHLDRFLDANDPKYLSLARFAQTFQAWGPSAGAAKKEPEWSVDADGVLRLG